MAFSYSQRKWTFGLNVEGFFNKHQGRPTNDDLVDFLRKDVDADLTELLQIQWNDLPSQRTVFLRFATDEAVADLESKIGGGSVTQIGVPWTACGGKRMGGFRCDGSTIVVKISYVSYEVPLDEVRKELEKYGIVRYINYSLMKINGLDHLIQDGIIMARLTLKPQCKELPCWVRRPATLLYPAEVWRFQHRGQQPPGCWNCGDPRHIGKRCRVPLMGLEENERPRTPVDRRNLTFSQMAQRNPPPPPQKRKQVTLEETETDTEGEVSTPQSSDRVILPDRVKKGAAKLQKVAADVHVIPKAAAEVELRSEALDVIEVVDSVETEVRDNGNGDEDVIMEDVGEDVGEDLFVEQRQRGFKRGGASNNSSLRITSYQTVEDSDLPASQPVPTGNVVGDTNGGEGDTGPVGDTGTGGEITGPLVGDNGQGGDVTVGLEVGGVIPRVDVADPGGGETHGGTVVDAGTPGGVVQEDTGVGGAFPEASGVQGALSGASGVQEAFPGASGGKPDEVEYSGASLPCGQGAVVRQEVPQVEDELQVEMVYMGAMEVLGENLKALTPSPRFLPSPDNEEIVGIISGEKFTQMTGSLPLGQGSSRAPNQVSAPPGYELSSSSSDLESGGEELIKEKMKRKDKDAKPPKSQDGGSKQ